MPQLQTPTVAPPPSGTPETGPSIEAAVTRCMTMWGEGSQPNKPLLPELQEAISADILEMLPERLATRGTADLVLEGTRIMAGSETRVDTFNSFMLRITLEPDTSLGEMRAEGVTTGEPGIDEIIYNLARVSVPGV